MVYNTLLGMDLFKQEFRDSFIFHIPHSSLYIPRFDGFRLDKVEENINHLTDWVTDSIFNVEGIDKIVVPFSRLFCDVERFEDDYEPMFSIGRGFFYTNGHDRSKLRDMDPALKKQVYTDYYLKHHELLSVKVKEKIDKFGVCHILDCHSFNDDNLKSPDICIGTDDFHTPGYLLDYTTKYFINHGYSVEINNPYSGCMIPKPYYKINNKVKGIMIEINKRLYMDDLEVNEKKVESLRTVLNGFIDDL